MNPTATISATAPVAAITPGTTIARATNHVGDPIELTVGKILRTDVRDIRQAGHDLIRETFDDPAGATWGAVGFVRTGDAWTAVQLLTSDGVVSTPLVNPFDVRNVRIADGIQLDSVWNIGHFGGDYTRMLKEWFGPTPTGA